jgi:hypothetical protein
MISDRQRLACELLASGKTGKETAQIIGVTHWTISHWKRCERFQRELANRHLEQVQELRAQLLGAAQTAISALTRVCVQDEDLNAAVTAAKSLLSHARITPESSQGVSGADLAIGQTSDLPADLQDAINAIEQHLSGGESTPFTVYLDEIGALEGDQLEAVLSDQRYLAHLLQTWGWGVRSDQATAASRSQTDEPD